MANFIKRNGMLVRQNGNIEDYVAERAVDIANGEMNYEDAIFDISDMFGIGYDKAKKLLDKEKRGQ